MTLEVCADPPDVIGCGVSLLAIIACLVYVFVILRNLALGLIPTHEGRPELGNGFVADECGGILVYKQPT